MNPWGDPLKGKEYRTPGEVLRRLSQCGRDSTEKKKRGVVKDNVRIPFKGRQGEHSGQHTRGTKIKMDVRRLLESQVWPSEVGRRRRVPGKTLAWGQAPGGGLKKKKKDHEDS